MSELHQQGPEGLSGQEASERLEAHGRNELVRTSRVRPLRILLTQFTSPLILVLVAAAAVSVGIGFVPGQESNTVDAVLILLIVLLSGLFGFIQDYKAEKTIEALQQMGVPLARVVRDGVETEIPSAGVVPGDILLLEPGDMITADGKVLKGFDLEADESVLTGESAAVRKQDSDEVFSNTYVIGGNARVLVTATGMRTRIGQVAGKLQEMKEGETSFERELTRLGKMMSLATLGIALLIAVIGYFKFGLYHALLTAISLAVAAIPEGLPAVVVLALAVGANIMVRRKALIRRLSVVESIGAVDTICTDKTGTLTKNEMTVTRLWCDGIETDLGADTRPGDTARLLLTCGTVCNNSVSRRDDQGAVKYLGEQTEIALRQAGERFLEPEATAGYEKVNEVSFSSERKMMTVEVRDGKGARTVFSKGAPEVLLEKCDRVFHEGKVAPLTPEAKQRLLAENERLAGEALRVLGFAYKPLTGGEGDIEENLVWIGLQGMIDPPRDEAPDAIRDCLLAGIRIIMITGDNPVTAGAIAKRVGLESKGTVTGTELEAMDQPSLEKKLESGVNIFARTSPFHKLRILEALGKDHDVAMTGDGVNDALAIKQAGVGLAMGIRGTEVAKQASDIVLLDDNFSTIREAVRQGRTIFANIRKFINYLLTCNFAEVAVIFLATMLFTLNEPVLFPVQLLWINLLTDGLVALALGVDPPAGDIMKQKPRKRKEPVINRPLGWMIVLVGAKMSLVLLATFYLVLELQGLEKARTVLFAGFVLYEFVRIASIRYQEKLGWFANKWLWLAMALSLLLQVTIIYTPLAKYFYVVPLALSDWGILVVMCAAGFVLSLPITRLVMKRTKGIENE